MGMTNTFTAKSPARESRNQLRKNFHHEGHEDREAISMRTTNDAKPMGFIGTQPILQD